MNGQFHSPTALTMVKETPSPLRRQGVLYSRCGRFIEKKHFLPILGIEQRFFGGPVCGLVFVYLVLTLCANAMVHWSVVAVIVRSRRPILLTDIVVCPSPFGQTGLKFVVVH